MSTSTFHKSATHVDAHGLPVALTETGWAFHPTPCCGAAVSIFTDDGSTYCKGCYETADELYGGVPAEPFKPLPLSGAAAKQAGLVPAYASMMKGKLLATGQSEEQAETNRVAIIERWSA